MKTHHYAVGDRVLYTEQRFPHLVCRQPYTIVGCLDSRRPEPQYRIRSSSRPFDCVAGEDELSQVASPVGVYRAAEISGLLDFPTMDDPANLNLVPWMHLPRRARHRNEQVRLFRQ
ncbi:hypothetical protein [Microvirga arsenatis]|uniref:Uncharacterized protein n=1 Tax=Microvirga arsenatis TaxID=2692265 RepID=A0ABW9YUA6_9HYPH|nr:hypothetical protein [Microvirga arsenatis]NBJ11549.1 hypothetical protein [Microvirga arsenatis]NBJ22758.1 hypothetical protein [Microvirga arsenatis]